MCLLSFQIINPGDVETPAYAPVPRHNTAENMSLKYHRKKTLEYDSVDFSLESVCEFRGVYRTTEMATMEPKSR